MFSSSSELPRIKVRCRTQKYDMFGRLQLERQLLKSTRLQHLAQSVWSSGETQPLGFHRMPGCCLNLSLPGPIARLILFGNIPLSYARISNTVAGFGLRD